MMLGLESKVIECLKENPKQQFTAREIAKWIFKNHREKCEEIKRSLKIKTNKDLLDRITFRIIGYTPRLLKENSRIKATEDRPRKCYWTPNGDPPPSKETDLYPVLIKFLWSALKIYSKRIDEKRSINSLGARGNKWLHPDIVGLENLSEDWHREIKDCVKWCSDKKTRLWSFEVKKKISRSNVRECYFQAVSNSSWANFGYLVADKIGDEALGELRILAGLLGVGLIKLDRENSAKSQIVIPAKERPGVDWNVANRLAKENKDFLNCVKSVREFYQTDRVDPASWDTKKHITK